MSVFYGLCCFDVALSKAKCGGIIRPFSITIDLVNRISFALQPILVAAHDRPPVMTHDGGNGITVPTVCYEVQ